MPKKSPKYSRSPRSRMPGTTFKAKFDAKGQFKDPDHPQLSEEETAALKAKEEKERLEAEAHFLAQQKSSSKIQRDSDQTDQKRAEDQAAAEAARVQAQKEADHQAMVDKLKQVDAQRQQKIEDDKKFVEAQQVRAQAEVARLQAEARQKQAETCVTTQEPPTKTYIISTIMGPVDLARAPPERVKSLIIGLKSSSTKLNNHFGSKIEYRAATPESSYKFLKRCELLIAKHQMVQEFMDETGYKPEISYNSEGSINQITMMRDKLLQNILTTETEIQTRFQELVTEEPELPDLDDDASIASSHTFRSSPRSAINLGTRPKVPQPGTSQIAALEPKTGTHTITGAKKLPESQPVAPKEPPRPPSQVLPTFPPLVNLLDDEDDFIPESYSHGTQSKGKWANRNPHLPAYVPDDPCDIATMEDLIGEPEGMTVEELKKEIDTKLNIVVRDVSQVIQSQISKTKKRNDLLQKKVEEIAENTAKEKSLLIARLDQASKDQTKTVKAIENMKKSNEGDLKEGFKYMEETLVPKLAEKIETMEARFDKKTNDNLGKQINSLKQELNATLTSEFSQIKKKIQEIESLTNDRFEVHEEMIKNVSDLPSDQPISSNPPEVVQRDSATAESANFAPLNPLATTFSSKRGSGTSGRNSRGSRRPGFGRGRGGPPDGGDDPGDDDEEWYYEDDGPRRSRPLNIFLDNKPRAKPANVTPFGGDIRQWSYFKNAMKLNISQEQFDNEAFKAIRLKEHLKDKALQDVFHLCEYIDETTYKEMWRILDENYGGQDKIVNLKTDLIMKIPKLKKMDVEEIRNLKNRLSSYMTTLADNTEALKPTFPILNRLKYLVPESYVLKYKGYQCNRNMPDNIFTYAEWLEEMFKFAQHIQDIRYSAKSTEVPVGKSTTLNQETSVTTEDEDSENFQTASEKESDEEEEKEDETCLYAANKKPY